MIPKKYNVVWMGEEVPEREANLFEKAKSIVGIENIKMWRDDDIDKLIKNHYVENFVKRAISERKFAFASDAIKLIILEKFGGWALDSDVEIYNSFDCFSDMNWVSGFELYGGNSRKANYEYKPITAVWGSVVGHAFTKIILDKYNEYDYNFITTNPNTSWISQILFYHGVKNDNQKQYCKALDVMLFPSEVFCGPFIENKSYSHHHFTCSWC